MAKPTCTTLLRVILTLVLLTCLIERAPAQLTPRDLCFIRFQALNFTSSDYAKYPTYFAETSTVTLSEAGQYVGPQDIEEYLRFEEPYVATKEVKSRRISMKSYDAAAGTCTARILNTIELSTDARYAYPARFTRVALLKFTYSMALNKIISIVIYYPKPYLRMLFGTLLSAPQTLEYICSTLATTCSDVHKLNGAPDTPTCVRRLRELPTVSNGAYLDGLDTGCRVLHASFTALSPRHCPHISFMPCGDSQGKIKCQKSAVIAPLELVDAEDLVDYGNFSSPIGIEPSKGFTVACLDNAGWNAGDTTQDCAWVAQDPGTRCALPAALYSCAATCDPSCMLASSPEPFVSPAPLL